jgi:hypothetical protein
MSMVVFKVPCMALGPVHYSHVLYLEVHPISRGAGLWTMMRGNAATDNTPTCTIDVLLEVHEENQTEWAAKVVQLSWNRWRRKMGLLLLYHGLADLGNKSVQYASLLV